MNTWKKISATNNNMVIKVVQKILGFPEKEKVKVAYKATTLDGKSTVALTSRNVEEETFVPGKVYTVNNPQYISPTIHGYHFCRYLTQVLGRRPYKGKLNKKNKKVERFLYYRIEVLGTVKEIETEAVTSKIRITNELDVNEIKNILLQEEKYFSDMLKLGKYKRYYRKLLKICIMAQEEIK